MLRSLSCLAVVAAAEGFLAPGLPGHFAKPLRPSSLRASRPVAPRSFGLGLRMVSQEVAQGLTSEGAQASFPTALPSPDLFYSHPLTGSTLDPELAALSPQLLLAFADQGSNLAGKFFQASLLPYLLFLNFLSNKQKNATPNLSFFGFQFLLLFVIATIPTGIISKVIYGVSLADVDWLHGSAEALLTITNLLIVTGFRRAMQSGTPTTDYPLLKNLGLATVALVAAFAATGSNVLGFEAHTPFLSGLGNLPAEQVAAWGLQAEPENALSLPTWAIHSSSVFEWLFAMGLVWDYAKVTKNDAWKGLTWGMLPLHASGVAACTYHFFYNNPELSFLVALQAGLTCLGNATVMLAALRIAMSNGWTAGQLNPMNKEEAAPVAAVEPRPDLAGGSSDLALLAKLTAMTVGSAYLVKYGSLALSLPFEANAFAACAMVATPPALVAFHFFSKDSSDDSGNTVLADEESVMAPQEAA